MAVLPNMETSMDISLYEPAAKRNCLEGDLKHLFETHLPSTSSKELYSEICVLQQRLASHPVDSRATEEQGERVERLSLPPIPSFLESALRASTETEPAATPQLCAQRLAQVLSGGQRASDDQDVCLLSAEQKIGFGVVTSFLRGVKEQQPDKWSDVVVCLLKVRLSLEVIWRLDVEDIVSLQTSCDSVLRDKRRWTHLTQQLLRLCVCQQDPSTCRNIISAVCGYFVKTGFPEKKSEDATLRKVSIGIVDGVTRGLLDGHMSEGSVLLPASVLGSNVHVSPVCFKKFCTHTISLIMSHRSNMKVSEALKRQTEWKSGKIPDNLKDLYKQLLVPFASGEVVLMLRRILEKQEVNWQTLLSYIATFLVSFTAAATHIQEHVSGLFAESLKAGDMENTIVAFLLARQSCAEGAHVFPAYPQWFQKEFGDGAKSPAASKKSFTFLIKFLTDLVPFEPADVLKVHILRPPFIPAKCRDLWTDYSLLAKTRLADLKVPLDQMSTAMYTDQGRNVQGTSDLQGVEKAIFAFESSGKVPRPVMEASIFRRKYFVDTFLPALLHPRHLPDVADSRMRLIEALRTAGKIPSSLVSKYKEQCRQETQNLLQGVFEVDEDEGVEEMLLEPLEQLSQRLQHLSEAVLGQSGDAKVSELTSVVSEKVEMVLDGATDVTESQSVFVLDLCQPALSSSHVQVVDAVLNCVCTTVHSAGPDPSHQTWLRQLVRMLLSQHLALLPALLVRLLSLLSPAALRGASLLRAEPRGVLLDHHVEGIAAVVYHLTDSHALFPAVSVKQHDSQRQLDAGFISLFLRRLPVGTGDEIALSHQFLVSYLKTAFLCEVPDSKDSPRSDVTLPLRLLTLFSVLSWRRLPLTRPYLHRSSQGWRLPAQQGRQEDAGREREEEEREGEEEEEEGRGGEAVGYALFASDKFQQLLGAHPPALEDWLDLELRVLPAQDCLTALQRQTYHCGMLGHFSGGRGGGEGAASGQPLTGLSQSCTVLFTKLVTALSRCQASPIRCPRCQSVVHHDLDLSADGVNTESALALLSLLARLVPNLETSDEAGSGSSVWLVQRVLELTVLPECQPLAVLRVVLSCPPHLLFTDSLCQDPSQAAIKDTLRFLQDFLVSVAEGGVLPLDVICHLLQGYMQVTERCRDRSAIKPFEDHPLIVLSTLVHCESVEVLVPALFGQSSPWSSLPPLLDAYHRFFKEGTLLLPDTSPRHAFGFAAAAFVVAADRGLGSNEESRKDLVRQMHQIDVKAVGLLGQLLLVWLSGDHCSSAQQGDIRQVWLCEIWREFPQLVCQAASGVQSELTSVTKSLMSADLRPFMELAILRCAGCVAPEAMATEPGVVAAVVRLFSGLCGRFQDASPPGRQERALRDVGQLMELSATVQSLLAVAPVSVLQALDVELEQDGATLQDHAVVWRHRVGSLQMEIGYSLDDIKQCGLEVLSLFQARNNVRA